MKYKVFILLIFPLVSASTVAANHIDTLTITEIKSVMPDNAVDGSAKNHLTQVMVEGWEVLPKEVTFIIVFIQEPYQFLYKTTVTIDEGMTKDQLPIIFDGPVPDADEIILEAMTPEELFQPLAIATETLTLRDLEARVAILDNDHVRLTAGMLRNVTDGVVTCKAENSPCFFSREELKIFPPVVERCKDFITDARNTLRYCDETVSDFIGILKDPTLLLLDETDLNVRHNGINITNIEVVALGAHEHCIDRAQSVDCSPVDVNKCRLVLDVDISKETKFIMINYVDEEGYVEASAMYPFENFQTNALGLTANALGTNWITKGKNNFEVLVKTSADIDGYVLRSEVTCGEASQPCEAFFLDLHKPEKYYISVGLIGSNSLVAKSVSKEVARSIDIYKMTRTNNSHTERLTTNFLVKADSRPMVARLVDISLSGKTVNQTFHNGETNDIPNGYIFICNDEMPGLEEERRFLLVEYYNSETKNIKRAGVIYLQNEVIAQFDWLAERSVLKGIVTKPDIINIEDQSCNSTCYLTGLETQAGFLTVCNAIKNLAPEGNYVEYCEDWTPATHPELQVMKIQLNEGEIESKTGKISVRAPYSTETTAITLVLHSNSAGQRTQELICNLKVDEGDTTCSTDSILKPSSSAALQVLVIGATDNGTITESAIVDVEHLEFSIEKLFSDTLLVRWTAIHTNYYRANLTTSIVFDTSNRNGNGESITSSDVTCSENSEVTVSSSCNAYFYNLPEDQDYSVIVHNKGKKMSETAQHIGDLSGIKEPEGSEVNILKVTKITESKTKLIMEKEITGNKMEISVLVNSMEGASQVSGENIKVDHTHKVLLFTHHDLIWFDDSTEVIFTVISYQDSSLSIRGKTDFNVQMITSNIAWVGGEDGSSTASLRVDVGNQWSVSIGRKVCLKENSPCYYIQDSSIETQGLERCVMIGNVIEQCDEVITSFEQLQHVELSLQGTELKVTAPLYQSGAVLEVKIYDPENTTAEFSIGNTICSLPDKANEDSIICKQSLKIPSDRRPVKVLVSEIRPDGAAIKSSLADIQFPSEVVRSWVIAVSILGSIFVASILVCLAFVAVKRKKSLKLESKTVEKEFDILSEVTSRHAAFINQATSTHAMSKHKHSKPNPSAHRVATNDVCEDHHYETIHPQSSSGGSLYYQSPIVFREIDQESLNHNPMSYTNPVMKIEVLVQRK